MLTDEMRNRIKRMAWRTWETIASDIIECVDESYLERDEVIEVVMDADYMMYHGRDKEAYEIYKGLPYEKQLEIMKNEFNCQRYY